MTDPITTLPRILVVEDEPIMIRMLNEVLRTRYEVQFAASGEQALALVGAAPPELILLDVGLPDLNGYEVCRRLRDNPATRDIPVIFLTKRGERQEILQGFEAGGKDYVLKDAGLLELMARVTIHLQIRRQQVALESALEQNRMLLREVNHRVKNNLNVVCSLLSLQANQVKDPRVAELFAEARNRVAVMSGIHEALYHSTSLCSVTAGEFFTTITHNLVRTCDWRDIHIQVSCGDLRLGMDELIPCGLIVNELVTNALKYAFTDGRRGMITITLTEDGPGLLLTLSDDGVGLPEGLTIEKAESLGLVLVTSLVQQLGGTLEIDRSGGTVFMIRFVGQEQR
jgi:two-component sensor histidine kinase